MMEKCHIMRWKIQERKKGQAGPLSINLFMRILGAGTSLTKGPPTKSQLYYIIIIILVQDLTV